jgi:hypothetical protein
VEIFQPAGRQHGRWPQCRSTAAGSILDGVQVGSQLCGRPVQLRQEQPLSIGASTRWVLARRRLVIVAWLLVAVVGLAAGGKGISALSRQSAS